MTAVNIEIRRGNTYDNVANAKLAWTVAKDFTDGWTGAFTVRHRLTDAELIAGTATAVNATSIEVTLTTAETSLSSLDTFGPHPYDIQMSKNSNVQTAAYGACVIANDVTRPALP